MTPTRSGRLSLASLVTFGALASATATADEFRVTLRHKGEALGTTPILSAIPDKVAPGDYVLKSRDGNDEKVVSAKVYKDGEKTILATVLPSVPADASLDLTLSPASKSAEAGTGVEVRDIEGRNLEVLVGGKRLTIYRSDEPTKPYYYPLMGPGDVPYTRAYPMKNVDGETKDHPHQRSFWFTHGNVNGIDFWASDPVNKPSPKFGRIQETSREVMSSSGAVGVIRTTDDWIGPDDKKVCEDVRVVRFHDAGSVRIIDFDVTIKATNGPVTFADTKEGSFGLRVASTMDVNKKTGGRITNAEGVHDDAAWGKASPWVDYTGPVNGKTVGVAILNHPESFRYPTTWHVRTYGLFAANPFGWKDFGQNSPGDHVVPAGESIAFRYRVVLHEGDTEAARIDQAFRAYAQPPTVEVSVN